MNVLTKHFIECNKSPWEQTPDEVTYKKVGRVLYFQCSDGMTDWIRNVKFWPSVFFLRGKKLIAPAGFIKSWKSVRRLVEIMDGEIDLAVGYSHGAVLACFASVLLKIPAIAFGPPRFIFNKRRLFSNCTVVKTPFDAVTFVPPFYSLPRKKKTLKGKAERNGLPFLTWISGHSPQEYLQRLENE